jgi:hypothetical protein
MLSGEYGRITRQLGNIKNNIYFLFKILFSKFSYYGSRLRDFWYDTQKKAKNMRGTTGLKDGMRWRFGGNLNRHSSREIYGRHILST